MPDEEAGIDGGACFEDVQELPERLPRAGDSSVSIAARGIPSTWGACVPDMGKWSDVMGASVKPQFPLMTVVTPCCGEGLAVGSQWSCASSAYGDR